jgi:hypothetical protein
VANEHLAIYLNDHLAGAEGALELLGHLEAAYAGTAIGDLLSQLRADIDTDRQELERHMERLGIPLSTTRKVAGWLAEKAAYLKLAIDDKTSGAMRLFEGLEGLAIGIHGKWSLWQALAATQQDVPALQGIDYDRLAQRAEEQRSRVEVIRLEAAKVALAATAE